MKTDLRKKFIKLAEGLSWRKRRLLDREVCANLRLVTEFYLEKLKINQVLAYYPFFPNEPNIKPVIRWLLGIKAQVFLPQVSGRELIFRRITSLPKNLHPLEGKLTGDVWIPQLSSVVIVPGLCFDVDLNRLGRGGGYYDRFFAGLRNCYVKKIGVAYSVSILASLSTDLWDIKMDAVITDRFAIFSSADLRILFKASN